ncbi:MAG: hypothetical protein NPIRA05_20430 [Nitrospirales bacterium]|nr:MAG: hypothetical protein NPIRA05_20430 [Nitrospirales bacterium]
MQKLRNVNPSAAEYLSKIDPKLWAKYSIFEQGGSTWGHATSNIAECANALLLPARHLSPLRFLDHVTMHVMSDLVKRSKLAQRLLDEKKLLTNWVQTQFSQQQTLVNQLALEVALSGDLSGYVWSPKSVQFNRHFVNLGCEEGKFCDCAFFKDTKIVCRHMYVLAQKMNALEDHASFVEEYFPATMTSESYSSAWKDAKMVLPAMIPGDIHGITDAEDRVHPPKLVKQAGRPRKKRIRSRGAPANEGGVVMRRTSNRRSNRGRGDRQN